MFRLTPFHFNLNGHGCPLVSLLNYVALARTVAFKRKKSKLPDETIVFSILDEFSAISLSYPYTLAKWHGLST